MRWPLQPLLPASGDLRSVLSMPRSEVAAACGPCPLPGLLRCYRRICSLMLFTTSCFRCHDDRVKMAPHSDLVSCSVLRHCLMMIPISCVVLLQKAAGFFFEPARATAPASVSLLGVAEPRPCAESVCVSSHRPPSGHPQESALFPRALPASIDKEFDFATEAIGKLTGDGLGKWTANRMVIQFINGCANSFIIAQTALERLGKRDRPRKCTPRPPDNDQTTLKRQRVSVLSVWLRM